MKKKNFPIPLPRSTKGAALSEYVILMSMIAIVTLWAVGQTGAQIDSMFQSTANSLSSGVTTAMTGDDSSGPASPPPAAPPPAAGTQNWAAFIDDPGDAFNLETITGTDADDDHLTVSYHDINNISFEMTLFELSFDAGAGANTLTMSGFDYEPDPFNCFTGSVTTDPMGPPADYNLKVCNDDGNLSGTSIAVTGNLTSIIFDNGAVDPATL